MTRKKVKLAYIINDSVRRTTFKKRKKGLIKKVSELSTLCDVDACAIIYSPYDAQPDVFPATTGAQQILNKFKMMPKMEKSKKMVNQETFLRQQISKANEQLKKLQKENREKEITRLMFQSLTGAKGLQGLNILDLNDIGWLIEQTLKDINKEMERIGGLPVQVYKPPVVLMMQAAEKKLGNGGDVPGFKAKVGGMQRQPQWFMGFMNPHEQQHVGCSGQQPMLPYGENGPWSNGLHP